MEPGYVDGDLVLINPKIAPSSGDVVVARHPFKNLDVIKYVRSVDPDAHVTLESPAGDDSRHFGRPPVHTVKGVVTVNLNQRRPAP